MTNRVVSDWRALIGFVLLAVFYFFCPLDLAPGMIVDDLIAVPLLGLLAYAKGTSPRYEN